MRATEIRELGDEEVEKSLAESKVELFNLRFQLATGQLDNWRRIRDVKRQIARLQTIKRQRELGMVIETSPAVKERAKQRALEEEAAKSKTIKAAATRTRTPKSATSGDAETKKAIAKPAAKKSAKAEAVIAKPKKAKPEDEETV